MVSKEEAKRIATKELRFEIGTLPYLSDPEYDSETGYIFEIRYTKTDLPTRDEVEDPNTEPEVEFYKPQTIGEMIITDDGEIQRSSIEELEENIRTVRKQAENGEIEKEDFDEQSK